MEIDIYWQVLSTVPSMELDIYWPVWSTVPSMELDIYWPVLSTVPSKELDKSNRKAMNRNWSNQKANPALKTKAGNK